MKKEYSKDLPRASRKLARSAEARLSRLGSSWLIPKTFERSGRNSTNRNPNLPE